MATHPTLGFTYGTGYMGYKRREQAARYIPLLKDTRKKLAKALKNKRITEKRRAELVLIYRSTIRQYQISMIVNRAGLQYTLPGYTGKINKLQALLEAKHKDPSGREWR